MRLTRFGTGLVVLLLATSAGAREDFSGQTLTDVNFLARDLSGADFSAATLDGVQFSQANLTGANFEGATFGRGTLGTTDFSLANLTNANFSDARFAAVTHFEYADLTGAVFAGIDLGNASFGPQLHFDYSGRPPSFSGATMNCEFPWLWPYLDLEGAVVPACSNGLKTVENEVNGASAEVDPAAVAPPQFEPAAARVAVRSVLVIPVERMQLASDRLVADSSLAGNGIAVSTTGTDSSSCGPAGQTPCKTVAQGIARCTAVGTPCRVQIAYGSYNLSAPLNMVDQVSLIGGYVGGQPSAYQSKIVAPSGGTPAIVAEANITGTLKNLILVGTAAADASKASVVMSIVGTQGITLDTVSVQAGPGKDAGIAANGTATDGVAGNAYNAAHAPGAGGASRCSSDAAGGNGAPQANIDASCTGTWIGGCRYSCSATGLWARGYAGAPGESTGGKGSVVATTCTFEPTVGSPTSPGGVGGGGRDADTRAAAATNRIGTIDATTAAWSPVRGNDGARGLDGGGGGGGGAGAPYQQCTCVIFQPCSTKGVPGLGGGGGGSGGCGASGGQSGLMGGATFGIVLVNARFDVANHVKVVGALGGAGGQGGAGAPGGAGGAGGAGCGNSCGGAGQSGDGGAGGDGGASGGGAGGNGGPSVGIVLAGNSPFDWGPTGIYIYPGASGAPGKGGAGVPGAGTPAGADGQSGLAQATYSVPQQ